MKKARFTETQIVNILKLADSGLKVEEICHQNGISNATFDIYGLPPFCKCKHPCKTAHSLLEIFRHTDYVLLRRSPCVKPDLLNTRSLPC